jgi:hypothetical protein
MKLKTERYNFAFSKETSDKIKEIAANKTWKFATVIEKAIELFYSKEFK